MIRDMQMAEHETMQRERYQMSEEELHGLREGLKRKWEEVNREYQKLTHVKVVDTLGLKRRKETCEAKLE